MTTFRRGQVQVLANLTDRSNGVVVTDAPAVFDTDDPDVAPDRPRTGALRLAPQQALLLVDDAESALLGDEHAVSPW